MREILFRAKINKTKSEWVEGFYVHIPCGRFMCDEHLIQTIDADGRIGQLYNVYESTLGQFTGLTDKNGKKIFEGDILKDVDGAMDGIPRIVYWGGYEMAFVCPLVKKHWAYGTNNIPLQMMRYHNIEVIGNIHDNQELLEEGDS